MKVEVKGQATEAAIKKATNMLNQIGINPNPRPVIIGQELIRISPNNGNPYAVILSCRGQALVWKTKERKKKARPAKVKEAK